MATESDQIPTENHGGRVKGKKECIIYNALKPPRLLPPQRKVSFSRCSKILLKRFMSLT